MENKQFIGVQMLENSWAFIKEQLKAIDNWFFVAFLSFLAMMGCLVGGWICITILGVGSFALQEAVSGLLSNIPGYAAIMAITVFLAIISLALFVIYKSFKYCIGFWNVVSLNSLDVALGRPMRKFEQKDDRLNFIILFMLVGFLTIIGFLLLIIPGFIFMVRTSMAYPIMLEEKCSPWQAISKSFDMTRGNFWPLSISLGIFHILFYVPFVNIINLFVPFTSWNLASLYAQLKNQ